MSLGEFELIKKYFCQNDRGTGIELGIGDDCALLNLPKNKTLAITTDTQIEGIHFFSNTSPLKVPKKRNFASLSRSLILLAIDKSGPTEPIVPPPVNKTLSFIIFTYFIVKTNGVLHTSIGY